MGRRAGDAACSGAPIVRDVQPIRFPENNGVTTFRWSWPPPAVPTFAGSTSVTYTTETVPREGWRALIRRFADWLYGVTV
jgi:hypothetical protein